MNDGLKIFLDRIQTLNPKYINFLGTGLPGMAGTSIATQGANASGTHVLNSLRADANEFCKLYLGAGSKGEVLAAAKVVEGRITNLQVLGVIDEKYTILLLNELYDLVESQP